VSVAIILRSLDVESTTYGLVTGDHG
jgi:hypothetical protein